MPWNSDRIGDRKRSTACERAINKASAVPTRKAPINPARMRNTVDITSLSIEPVTRISPQRQKTSISDGNRYGGKNCAANCQSRPTATNGITKDHSFFIAVAGLVDHGDEAGCLASVTYPAPDRSSTASDRN